MKSRQQMPPRIFHSFFRWFCHPRLVDHIEGDLLEVYQRRLNETGKRKADIKFIIDVILLFRKGIIKTAEGYQNLNTYGMYKSYFKIGWRNLVRHKGYSLINIGGLALGITVAMLIGLWVYDEISFNNYHVNHDRIAQVYKRATIASNGEIRVGQAMQIPVATALKANYSHYFKNISLAFWPGEYVLSIGDNKGTRVGRFIEGGALNMLSIKMVKGSYSSLNDPHSIILSETVARAFFGNEDPIYKTMKIDNRMDVTVQEYMKTYLRIAISVRSVFLHHGNCG